MPTRPARNDIAPRLELVDVDVADLVAPARNVRGVDQAHVQEIATSINTLGYCAPLIIDQENRVLDGVLRLAAVRHLHLPTISCVRVAHLSRSERRVLRVALNRLGEKGHWNVDELRLELKELTIEDAPIEVAGFTGIEIDQINLDLEPEPQEPGPLGPTPGARAVAQLGDVFLLGDHIVACGDSTDPNVIRQIMSDDRLARLVLTDQPYNVPVSGHVTGKAHREFAMASGEMTNSEFAAFNARWLAAAVPLLCDGGVLGTFIDSRGQLSVTTAALDIGLAPLNLIVWAKSNGGMGSLYRSQHELLPLFKKGKASHVNNVQLGKLGRWRSNVWHYPGASSIGSDARQGLQQHPTVKPTAMLEDALLDLTNQSDVVLDPFLGSGSTLIAAARTSRICRGIEIDPLYVDVIIQRYQAITGDTARLQGSGESFASLAERRVAK